MEARKECRAAGRLVLRRSRVRRRPASADCLRNDSGFHEQLWPRKLWPLCSTWEPGRPHESPSTLHDGWRSPWLTLRLILSEKMATLIQKIFYLQPLPGELRCTDAICRGPAPLLSAGGRLLPPPLGDPGPRTSSDVPRRSRISGRRLWAAYWPSTPPRSSCDRTVSRARPGRSTRI